MNKVSITYNDFYSSIIGGDIMFLVYLTKDHCHVIY